MSQTADRAGLDRSRAEAVRRPVRFLLRRRALGRPAAGRRAGGRLRRPLERRQVLAGQRADRPQRPRPHLAHARAHAGAHLLRSPRRGDAWSTCRATATPPCRRRSRRLGDRLVRDYLRGRPTLLRVFVLVDGRHGLKESDHETMRLLDASAVSYAVVLTKRDEVKAAEQSARDRRDARGLAQARRGLSRGAVHLGPQRRRGGGAARAYRAAARGAERAAQGRAAAIDPRCRDRVAMRSPHATTTYNRFAGGDVGRIAALSDGIFAFAATVLVLDFHTPDPADIHTERRIARARWRPRRRGSCPGCSAC